MRKIYLLFLLVIIASCKKDSILTETENKLVINQKSTNDISDNGEINYLYSECLKYLYTDYEKTKSYAEKQLALSKDKNNKEGEASAYNILGIIEHNKKNYADALNNYALGLPIAIKASNQLILVEIYINIASVYKAVNLKSDANLYYNKALDLSHRIDNQTYIALIHFGLGLANRDIDDLKSIDHYKIALKIREEMGSSKGIAECYNEIGNIYFDKNQFKQAEEYYLKSLAIQENTEDLALSKNYFNLGLSYKKLNNYTASFDYHFKSLALDEKLNNQIGIKENRVQLGSLYLNQKKYTKAAEELTKAELIAEELHDNSSLIEISNLLFTTYTGIGNTTKAEYYKDKGKEIESNYLQEQIKAIQVENEKRLEVQRFNQSSLLTKESPEKVLWMIGIIVALISGAGVTLLGVKRKVKIVETPMIKLRDPKLVDLSWWHTNQLKWIEEEAIESKKLIQGIEAVIKESLDRPTKEVVQVILAQLKERLKTIRYWSTATNDVDPTPPPKPPTD